MTMRTALAAVLSATLLASCAAPRHTPRDADDGATFVIVRHAEKTDAAGDPALTDEGHARAEALAQSLEGQPLVAVYATAYQRTQQTAAPTAARHGLDVTTYDAKQPAGEFADTLRARHHSGTVLVVGHSNTAPDIAAALCGCTVAPMPETEYGRRMVVTFGPDGSATLDVSGQP